MMGVRSGAEGFYFQGGARGVLLIHGFGDTPQSVRGLGRALADAGFTVHGPRLAGHGEGVKVLDSTSAWQWRRALLKQYYALRHRCSSVSVVGFSMGGALAADLASRVDVARLVLLAPYVALPGWLWPLARTGRVWGPLCGELSSGGAESMWDPEARRQGLGYAATTGRALRELARAATWGWDAAPVIEAPTMIIQSRQDNRVGCEVARRYVARLRCYNELVWTVGAGHVIPADYGKESVARTVRSWLEVPMRRWT